MPMPFCRAAAALKREKIRKISHMVCAEVILAAFACMNASFFYVIFFAIPYFTCTLFYYFILNHEADTHSQSITPTKEPSSVAVRMDESLSVETPKWTTASTLPLITDRNQDSPFTKEKCSFCVCIVDSAFNAFVVITFVIVLTLIIIHFHTLPKYGVYRLNVEKIVDNNVTLSIHDSIDLDYLDH